MPRFVALSAMIVCASIMAPQVCAGEWKTAGSTNVTREYPGLALLPDGKVLAVTGHPLGGKSLASAEIYDPKRDVWTPTGSLAVPRNGVQHGGLIRLPNGKYFLAGGGSGRRSVHEVELYDAASGTWSMTGAMATPRCVHTVTQLEDGNIVAAGGIDWLTDEVHATAEVYDHASAMWKETGAMATPRFSHRAVRLGDGRVLVTGGHSAYPDQTQVVASAEIYDPAKGTWRETAPMHAARRSHTAIVLADGRVLVAGGATGEKRANPALASAEVFDPNTEQWTEVKRMRESRWGPTATLLPDGKVLVTGGGVGPYGSRRSAELFDPATGSWSDAGQLKQARNGHRSITLADGRVLIVGGHYVGRYLDSCEVYEP